MGKGDLIPRIITHFGVRLQPENHDVIEAAAPVNLSETGTCVRLAQPLKINQRIHVQIELAPETPPLTADGRVVWVRPDPINKTFYCGIGFSELTPDDAQRIHAYAAKGADQLLKFFSEFPLFADFAVEDCRTLLCITTLRQLQKKEILYHQDCQDVDLQGLFIVQTGLLSIFKGPQPRQERLLTVVSAGELFGETTLINDQPHSATIMAVNPSTLIQINKIGFRLIREQNPQLALKIMDVIVKTLAQRLGRTTARLFSPLNT